MTGLWIRNSKHYLEHRRKKLPKSLVASASIVFTAGKINEVEFAKQTSLHCASVCFSHSHCLANLDQKNTVAAWAVCIQTSCCCCSATCTKQCSNNHIITELWTLDMYNVLRKTSEFLSVCGTTYTQKTQTETCYGTDTMQKVHQSKVQSATILTLSSCVKHLGITSLRKTYKCTDLCYISVYTGSSRLHMDHLLHHY